MKKIWFLLMLPLLCSPSFAVAKDAEDDEQEEMTVTEAKPAEPAAAEESEETEESEEVAALPSATKAAMVGKVGKTIGVSIDENGKQDFDFDLPAGQFVVYCDAQRVGEGSLTTTIDSSLQLLKRNGAAIPQYSGDLIYWNCHEKEYRVGKAFSFTKPIGVRFRLTNQSNGANNFWLTVVPAKPFKFLPYGFGATPIAAKIGPNNGTGGTLEPREFAYIRAKMPVGKWSVSLSAQDKQGRCYVSLLAFDERGLDVSPTISLITTANDVGGEARTEKITTLTKPKTLIFRVYNEGAGAPGTITYDVTIEPSTD